MRTDRRPHFITATDTHHVLIKKGECVSELASPVSDALSFDLLGLKAIERFFCLRASEPTQCIEKVVCVVPSWYLVSVKDEFFVRDTLWLLSLRDKAEIRQEPLKAPLLVQDFMQRIHCVGG